MDPRIASIILTLSQVFDETASRTVAVIPSRILCADWGKDAHKRAVYIADVSTRTVRRIASEAWSLTSVVEEAERHASSGPVFVTFDVPIGVPSSYLAAARDRFGCTADSFLDLLTHVARLRRFFTPTDQASRWRLQQPFFSVPQETGGLSSYFRAAAQRGVNLYRSIDRATGAKPMFARSGIPGAVGAATCALWSELTKALQGERTFTIWPFEGELEALLPSSRIVLGEIYPRAAYATALLNDPVERRSRLSIAKTDAMTRLAAIKTLKKAEWIRTSEVALEDLEDACDGEDDFDACLTAAALLRCALENLPMHARLESPRVEGGILGTGSINLELRERQFRSEPSSRPASRASSASRTIEASSPILRCPIPGCVKEWPNGRGGWDGHVGSLKKHPSWHPDVFDAPERRRLFASEFPAFFERASYRRA
jgi:hypothetical protein